MAMIAARDLGRAAVHRIADRAGDKMNVDV